MCPVTITSGGHNHTLVGSEPHHHGNQHSLMSDGLIKEEEEKGSWFSLCAAECTKRQTHDVLLTILEQMCCQ